MTDATVTSCPITEPTFNERLSAVLRSVKLYMFSGIASNFGWSAHNTRYTKRVQFLALNQEAAYRKARKIRRKQGWRGTSISRIYYL